MSRAGISMNGRVSDSRVGAPHAGVGLASWYTAGRTDGLGDRLLMFDNTGAASLELLRFRPDLAAEPGFEDLLRQRVQRLSTFRHPSFPAVRRVEHLEEGGGLALVSTHAPGKRLSELLEGPHTAAGLHPAFVSWLVQQITPLLAALQAHGYDIVHGTLTLDRVVLTPEGRVSIVEYALGSAIRCLELSPSRLFREFGIISRPTSRGEACLDATGDVMQVGAMALSLLLGRRVTLQDVETQLPALLDEFSRLPSARASLFAAPLREWLERAMQMHPRAYHSAAEAQEGLRELPGQTSASLPALLGAVMPGARQEGPGTRQEEPIASQAKPSAPQESPGASSAKASASQQPSASPVKPSARQAMPSARQDSSSAPQEQPSFSPAKPSAPPERPATSQARLDAHPAKPDALQATPGVDQARKAPLTLEAFRSEKPAAARAEEPAAVQDDFQSEVSSAPAGSAWTADVRPRGMPSPPRPLPPATNPTASPVVELAALLPAQAADISHIASNVFRAASNNTARLTQLTTPATVDVGRSFVPRLRRWIIIGLAVVVLVEAAVIAVLWTRPFAREASVTAPAPLAITVEAAQPGTRVFVDDKPAGETPVKLTLGQSARSLRIGGAETRPSGALADTPAIAPAAAQASSTGAASALAAAGQRTGSIRFISPVALQVMEGTRVLGSTADGPIVVTAGTHQLDLVNTDLGFRTQQSVTIKAGEIASFTVTTPMGRLNVNAQPWARVWVDQSAVGETPIANLSVPIGQHEVTFRHPQLGERSETVLVRADGVTHLSATFER